MNLLLRRSLLVALVLAGCGAPTVTRSNPPADPAPTYDGAPYAGRIELEAPALHGYAEETWSVLRRRLALLEVPAQVTFDQQRAVVDVYGVEPATLNALAERLAHPMDPQLFGSGRYMSLAFADVRLVGRPREGCGCKATVRLDLSSAALRAMASPPGVPGSGISWTLASGFTPGELRDGERSTGLEVARVEVEWKWIESESELGHWEPQMALVYLAPPGDDVSEHLFYLGGGAFASPVTVRSVQPRGGP